jgi:hypothetical protein
LDGAADPNAATAAGATRPGRVEFDPTRKVALWPISLDSARPPERKRSGVCGRVDAASDLMRLTLVDLSKSKKQLSLDGTEKAETGATAA